MAYRTSAPERVIEVDDRRRRNPNLTDEQVEAAELQRQALADYFKTNGQPLDHHWDIDHPDYDAECTCGLSPEQQLHMLGALVGAAQYDAEASDRKRARRPMSPNQRSYLTSLRSRLIDPVLLAELDAMLRGESIDWGTASRMIDRVKDAMAASVRPNKFAGDCHRCTGQVEAQAGHLSQLDGRWVVEHVGPCPELPPEPAEPAGLDLRALRPGRYAAPGGETRLKLMVRRPTKGNWAGYTFVSDAAEYGVRKNYGRQGPGERDRYRGDITEALEAIVADPLAAMQAYGNLTGTCGSCGRLLEDEQSIELGIGPVCYGRMLEAPL